MWQTKPEREQKEETKQSRWGFRGMTVRDWLELLIVPVVLALITVVFTWQQNERQQDLETKRAQQAQKIENQRAEAEQELAKQRAQDEALQAYLDQMSTLVLEKKLRVSKPDSDVRTLARARTLTILEGLEGDPSPRAERGSVPYKELLDPSSALPARKRTIVQFLYEGSLINAGSPVILLNGADLESIDLSGADLSGGLLNGADLSFSDLGNADLSNTMMLDDSLNGAYLGGANLEGATLSGSDLTAAALEDANLSDASLRGVDLGGDNHTIEADLSGADLSGADLTVATGVTGEELERQAKSLKGATMPDGQKYEDWLKDR